MHTDYFKDCKYFESSQLAIDEQLVKPYVTIIKTKLKDNVCFPPTSLRTDVMKWFFSLDFYERMEMCSINSRSTVKLIIQLNALTTLQKNVQFLYCTKPIEPAQIQQQLILISQNRSFMNPSQLQFEQHMSRIFSLVEINNDGSDNKASSMRNLLSLSTKVLSIDEFEDTLTLDENILKDEQLFVKMFSFYSKDECFNKYISLHDPKTQMKGPKLDLPQWLHMYQFYHVSHLVVALFEQVIMVRYVISKFKCGTPYLKSNRILKIIEENERLCVFFSKYTKEEFLKCVNADKFLDEFVDDEDVSNEIRLKLRFLDQTCEEYFIVNKLKILFEAERNFNRILRNCPVERIIKLSCVWNLSQIKMANDIFFQQMNKKINFVFSESIVREILADVEVKEIKKQSGKKNKNKKSSFHMKSFLKGVILDLINTVADQIESKRIKPEVNDTPKKDDYSNLINEEYEVQTDKKYYRWMNKYKTRFHGRDDNTPINDNRNITKAYVVPVDGGKKLEYEINLIENKENVNYNKNIKRNMKIADENEEFFEDKENVNYANTTFKTQHEVGQKKKKRNIQRQKRYYHRTDENKPDSTYPNENLPVEDINAFNRPYYTTRLDPYDITSSSYEYYPDYQQKKLMISHPMSMFYEQFHYEIVNYTINVTNNLSCLHALRSQILERIEHVLYSTLYQYDVEIFYYGSQSNDLQIESSDIDIGVKFCFKEGDAQSDQQDHMCEVIKDITVAFSKSNLFEVVNPILTASMPVLKLVAIHPNINYWRTNWFLNNTCLKEYKYNKTELERMKVDITFSEEIHIETPAQIAVQFVQSALSLNPEIKPVVLVLKRLLHQKLLNNTYNGGLSSFSVFLLVLAYVKSQRFTNVNIGSLLMNILEFYSNFNFSMYYIDVKNQNPFVFSMRLEEGTAPIILDPVTSFNVSRSTYKIHEIKQCFSNALRYLYRRIASISYETNLLDGLLE